MQRHYFLVILLLLSALVFSAQGWAGDPAEKDASGALKMGYQAAKRGYWNEAMARYLHASKQAPGDAEIWSNLGVALEAVGQYAEAGDAYRRALELDPSNGKIHRNYGMYNDFYMSYIVRPEPDEEIEATVDQQGKEDMLPDESGATTEESDEATKKGAADASHS